ncbi:FAD-dependent monooxygenase [Allokutzneria oryzae]|uniref:FAD-dependent monooxygenase n=1 Tax=Allokutzneria oryzae TaxID=1378989 RepID=A0ABV5ZRD5_9PSEU
MSYDVVVSGAGPVGLMLACELRLAGVRVLVLERLTEIDPTIKAGAINLASGGAFHRRGLLGELQERHRARLAGAMPHLARMPSSRIAGHFAGIMLSMDVADLDEPAFESTAPLAGAAVVAQQAIEEILGQRAAELGADVRRGVEVTGFDADDDGVTVRFAGERVRASWLVGCDGGRSTVRKQCGFDFPGTDPAVTGRQAMVEMSGAEELKPGWNRTGTGIYVHGPIPGRVLTVEYDGPPADRDAPITAAEIEGSLRRTSGVDVTVHSVQTATRFTDNARQVSTYRRGRVLLAGDAAHVHSPFGGQGLNLGIGDAMNLGWKLAATVNGWAPEGLLDTYTTERHPIGAWVLEWTRAQIALMRNDFRTNALAGVMADLLATRDGTTYLLKKLSGVLHRYDLGDGHELLGLAVPDLGLSDDSTVAAHGVDGKAVVFDLADSAELRAVAGEWGDRVRVVTAKAVRRPELTGLFVRPDGHVAWASSDGAPDGLREALSSWLGTPPPSRPHAVLTSSTR